MYGRGRVHALPVRESFAIKDGKLFPYLNTYRLRYGNRQIKGLTDRIIKTFDLLCPSLREGQTVLLALLFVTVPLFTNHVVAIFLDE